MILLGKAGLFKLGFLHFKIDFLIGIGKTSLFTRLHTNKFSDSQVTIPFGAERFDFTDCTLHLWDTGTSCESIKYLI